MKIDLFFQVHLLPAKGKYEPKLLTACLMDNFMDKLNNFKLD